MLSRIAPVVVLLPLALAALRGQTTPPTPDALEPVMPRAEAIEIAAPKAEASLTPGDDDAGWGSVRVTSS